MARLVLRERSYRIWLPGWLVALFLHAFPAAARTWEFALRSAIARSSMISYEWRPTSMAFFKTSGLMYIEVAFNNCFNSLLSLSLRRFAEICVIRRTVCPPIGAEG